MNRAMTATTQDRCLRAMTDDGGLRVMTARTTDTARGVLAPQKCTPEVGRWLADLVTGTILVRETMAPDCRVQGIIHGLANSGALVADSHPDGGSRGLIQRRTATLSIGQGSIFEMMRTLPNGSLNRGAVQVSGDNSVSRSLMTYMQESEQVVTMIDVATVFEGDRVKAAGGYIVQLLPELSEPMLAIMTERLADLPPVEAMLRDDSTTPDIIMSELLYLMPHTVLSDSPLMYKCRCDISRLMASLATLPRADVMEMIRDGKKLEIQCDYCLRDYRIDPQDLRGIVNQN
jgi:molecular chaperone Hsp33